MTRPPRVACAVCGRRLDPRAAVGVGTPPRPVHVAVCFDRWLGKIMAAVCAAVARLEPQGGSL